MRQWEVFTVKPRFQRTPVEEYCLSGSRHRALKKLVSEAKEVLFFPPLKHNGDTGCPRKASVSYVHFSHVPRCFCVHVRLLLTSFCSLLTLFFFSLSKRQHRKNRFYFSCCQDKSCARILSYSYYYSYTPPYLLPLLPLFFPVTTPTPSPPIARHESDQTIP